MVKIPDLKPSCPTNPFLHSLFGSICTASMESDQTYCALAFVCFSFFSVSTQQNRLCYHKQQPMTRQNTCQKDRL